MTQRTALAAFRRSILVSFIAVTSLFFACSGDNGDDNNETPSSSDGGSSSSSIEAQTPSSSGGSSSSSLKSNSLLLNFASDYASGELRWMATDSTSLVVDAISFNQDSRVSTGGGSIFVMGNFPGTLACILPEKINDRSAIKEIALDAMAPYEVAVVGSKGYIALNDDASDYVQVFDIGTCAASSAINLPITKANAASIKASGDTLLVALQRLDATYYAAEPGLLVRIKASTGNVIDTIQLKLYNPNSTVLSKGKLYVSSTKYNTDYSVVQEESGVEVVDLATGTSEILVTGTQLGGGAGGIALDEANQILYVSAYATYGVAPVKPLNLANKSVGSALPNISDSFGGLVFDNVEKKLFVGDRDFASSGLKIYDPAAKTTTAVNQGANALPPYSLAIIRW